MNTWIEQLSARHAVLVRNRFTSLPVRLGRGYASDFILDDASAAPEHLTISCDPDGLLMAAAVGDAHFQVAGNAEPLRQTRIDANTVICVGKILLRVRRETDVLEFPNARAALADESHAEYLRLGMLLSVLLVFCGIALFALRSWLANTEGAAFIQHFVDRLSLLYGLVPWVGFWLLLCYAFAGQSRISRHLFIAGLGLSALAIVKLGLSLLSSGLAVALAGWLDLPLTALVVVATLMAHIADVGGGRRISPAVAVSMLAICVATGAGWYQERLKSAPYARTAIPGLAPAQFRLAPIQDRNEVLDQLSKIESEVAAEREAPLPDELR